MSTPLTRRAFLGRSAAVAASATLLPLLRVSPSLAAAPAADLEDLVDTGNTFARGAARGASVSGGAVRATADGGTFTSVPLRASDRFTHVGLHWAAVVPPRASLAFELRTSADGVTWTPWQHLHVERQPGETPVGDYFASLAYAGGAQYVQYRATFRTPGGASPTLQRVTATTIDAPVTATTTTDSNKLPTTDVPDTTNGRTLKVVSRAQWEANESYRFNNRKQEIWPEMFVPVKKLIVHHTAGRNTCSSAADAKADVQAIYKYHAVTQRWGDIGYNALIDKFGNIYEGRHGRGGDAVDTRSPECLSAGVVAGHDSAHNYGSAGVALLGDATAGDWATTGWSEAMRQALDAYCTFESGRSALRPLNGDGTITVSPFLRSDDTWADSTLTEGADDMPNVSGHKETNATACPGEVMAHLPALRIAIRDGLSGQSQLDIPLRSPASTAKETTTGIEIVYQWDVPRAIESGWTLAGYEYCIEGWYKPSNSYDIQYLSGYDSTDPKAQPVQRWRRVDSTASDTFLNEKVSATDRTVAVTPTAAGHYTFHVRALLTKADGTEHRGAYASSHTYLVKAASSTTGGGKKPRR